MSGFFKSILVLWYYHQLSGSNSKSFSSLVLDDALWNVHAPINIFFIFYLVFCTDDSMMRKQLTKAIPCVSQRMTIDFKM